MRINGTDDYKFYIHTVQLNKNSQGTKNKLIPMTELAALAVETGFPYQFLFEKDGKLEANSNFNGIFIQDALHIIGYLFVIIAYPGFYNREYLLVDTDSNKIIREIDNIDINTYAQFSSTGIEVRHYAEDVLNFSSYLAT